MNRNVSLENRKEHQENLTLLVFNISVAFLAERIQNTNPEYEYKCEPHGRKLPVEQSSKTANGKPFLLVYYFLHQFKGGR